MEKLKSWASPPSLLIKRRYVRFQKLLKNYLEILEILTDALEKQGGGFVLDKQYIVALTNKLCNLADSIVYDLNVLTDQQYLNFYDPLDRFKKETKEIISGRPAFLHSELVIPFSNTKEFLPQHVGRKNASLINLHHRIGIPLPEGFAITFSAYQRVVEENNLIDSINRAVNKFRKNDPYATQELLALRDGLRSAKIPSNVKEPVHHALHSLTEKLGNDLLLTIDFTIQGETLDAASNVSDYTKTVSNVKPAEVFDIYLEEISSLYDPAMVCFRQIKKMGERAFLAAVCKRMILGKIHGELYTLNPASPASGFMLLNIYSESDHKSKPRESYTISRNPPFEIVPNQDQHEKNREEESMSSQQSTQHCKGGVLSYDEIVRLIDLALRIERYFRQAQEIEWIKDIDSQFIIAQTKRLNMQSTPERDQKNLAKILSQHRVLYDSVGQVACRGVAGGPVFLVHNEKDINEFPDQGVLVAPSLLPEWKPKRSMQKAAAILTDSGKPTGPMVSLARHFRIPFIVGLGNVTKRLFTGTMVTIDADENVVYEGLIKELENYHLIEGLGYGDEPEYQMFQIVQDKIAHLTLANCAAQEFTINSCQTLHDVVHLAYENAVKALMDEDSCRKEFSWMSKQLKGNRNLVFQVINIGDGLKSANVSEPVINFKDIQSRPMVILGEAICTPGKWVDINFSQRKVTGSSAVADSISFNKKNVAVVSKEYLNLVMNLGCEIDMVDSYLCEEGELNHIFCRFSNIKGEYRPRFILTREVMQRLDFDVEETTKAINAWISRISPSAIEKRLRIIGHLINFIRILDEGGYSDMSSENLSSFFFQKCA